MCIEDHVIAEVTHHWHWGDSTRWHMQPEALAVYEPDGALEAAYRRWSRAAPADDIPAAGAFDTRDAAGRLIRMKGHRVIEVHRQNVVHRSLNTAIEDIYERDCLGYKLLSMVVNRCAVYVQVEKVENGRHAAFSRLLLPVATGLDTMDVLMLENADIDVAAARPTS